MAIFQTYFPQGQAAVFLSAESGEPRGLPGEPGAGAPMYHTGVMATTESRRLEVK